MDRHYLIFVEKNTSANCSNIAFPLCSTYKQRLFHVIASETKQSQGALKISPKIGIVLMFYHDSPLNSYKAL
jgi:hypothetical protein